MKMINITEAKAQLSSVIQEILQNGEEILIGKAGKPVVKISRYDSAENHQRLGKFKNKIQISDDFDSWPDDVAQALGIKDS